MSHRVRTLFVASMVIAVICFGAVWQGGWVLMSPPFAHDPRDAAISPERLLTDFNVDAPYDSWDIMGSFWTARGCLAAWRQSEDEVKRSPKPTSTLVGAQIEKNRCIARWRLWGRARERLH